MRESSAERATGSGKMSFRNISTYGAPEPCVRSIYSVQTSNIYSWLLLLPTIISPRLIALPLPSDPTLVCHGPEYCCDVSESYPQAFSSNKHSTHSFFPLYSCLYLLYYLFQLRGPSSAHNVSTVIPLSYMSLQYHRYATPNPRSLHEPLQKQNVLDGAKWTLDLRG